MLFKDFLLAFKSVFLLIGLLFPIMAKAKKVAPQRVGCFERVARLGVESLNRVDSLASRQPLVIKYLSELRKVYPDNIDDYAMDFYRSNGKWPTAQQIIKKLLKQHSEAIELIRKIQVYSDYEGSVVLTKMRRQIQMKRVALIQLEGRYDPRVYRMGDPDLKHELQKFIHGIYGDVGELSVWYRTGQAVALNYHFGLSARHRLPQLKRFQQRRLQLIESLELAEPEQVMKLAEAYRHTPIFERYQDVEAIRRRMIELLKTKEIDVVAQDHNGRLLFVEVKNYDVVIDDIDSTQYSKKSLSFQMSELRWVIDNLDMDSEIDLGFMTTGRGIHPRESRRLNQMGIRVFSY